MIEKRIIAIIGATGAQGGGLADAILSDSQSEFSVRAITRNINADKAKALADRGAEVVSADLDDTESLEKAFNGAYGVFGVTNFWEHFSPEKETAQAKNIADAALAAGIKHVIWSSLEDTRDFIPLDDNRMPTLMGKYKVPHFDSKGEAEKFFQQPGLTSTILRTSFYWDNYIYFGLGPKKGPDGVLAITFPMGDKKLPGIVAVDIGKCAYGIFKAGEKYKNKTIGIAGEHLTGAQMAASFTRVIGAEVKYNDVPADVYRSFGFPGADEMGNMFQFKRDFEADFVGGSNLEVARSINPSLQSFDQWLDQNAGKISIE
ncbi:MAG TPA: NmrA/HSCARG family protein [Bacteroidales bacterium]|nr:NmrA/HSCARG family protein [Bacteroidales bacterium]HPM91771.1 NmrA/HSCARG family protein [Bacteroidales bacterium]